MQMNNLLETAILAAVALVALFTVGFIFSRLYQRASKERAFVRTGLGGQKVIMDGGALKLPVFHELIWVNMNTLKLEVHRSDKDSLFTKDRMRVDVVAAFFVRVTPTVEGIANAAQTLGQRTLDSEALKSLVEDKFVDALRAASVFMTMQDLLDKRQDFIQAVQNAVAEDLTKNGLELESVSLTSFDQTGKEFFNADNAFDAEGLTRLTQETQKRAKERNDIEQNTQVAIAQKNYEATQQKLDIEKNQRMATLQQQQEVATREAEQAALVASTQAQRKREAEQARIDAERQVKEAEVVRDRQVKVAQIDQERATQIADQERSILVAKKSEEQSQAEARANEARAEAVKAEQLVITAGAVAEAQREKDVELVEADKQAQKQAIGVKVSAEAEKDAAENHAQAIKIRAEANLRNYEVEAEGKAKINEAINKLSVEQIAMQVKLALIQALPQIIAESVKPIEKIDGIKIVQVDGLTRGGANGAAAGAAAGNGGGSLADQAVGAALSYRAQQPIVDALLQELGFKGGSLASLGESIATLHHQPQADAGVRVGPPVMPPQTAAGKKA
jgi:uncharacterized membrane protein YqiK